MHRQSLAVTIVLGWMLGCQTAAESGNVLDAALGRDGGEQPRPPDAGCPACLPRTDAGVPPGAKVTDDVDAGAKDASGCVKLAAPACDRTPCTWAAARAQLPRCATPPLTPYYAGRCGDRDAFVSQGTDSVTYYIYDAAGRLVGTKEVGLGAGCTAYDDAFQPPERCERVTPKCPAEEDAGS
jgi:hypothetical protein